MELVLGMEVGLSPEDFVLDGDPVPFPQKAHLYCGETAACIKMSLGMELSLGPGDFVLDGDPAPHSPKGGGGGPANFQPMFIMTKRLDGWSWYLEWR